MATEKKPWMKLEPDQVEYSPLIREHGTHISTRYNAYPFEVNPQCTKTENKEAVEELWEVRVVAVRTQNRIGKPRRTRNQYGRTRNWKKAIVQLHDEDRIAFF